MIVTQPTFVVADLPDEIAAWVRATREVFEPAILHLPAEITLAGSSGVGPICTGQDVESVRSKLVAAIAGRLPFEARFTGIGNSPGTDIYFAAPEPPPFLAMHRAILGSGIAFGPSAFPYTPHCSLKGLTALRPGQREALLALSVPSEPFAIRAVSVYQVDRMQASRLLTIEG